MWYNIIEVLLPFLRRSFSISLEVVGIDLGTTFSVVALKAMDGSVSVIPDHVSGKQLLPSVVSFLEQEVLVGDKAVAQRGT